MENHTTAIDAPRVPQHSLSNDYFNLLIPNRAGDHILAILSPTNVLQFPTIRKPRPLPSRVDIWTEAEVVAQFGIRVHFVHIRSDRLDQPSPDAHVVYGADGSERANHIIILDLLDDYPDVLQPLQWIPRDRAVEGEWMELIRGFHVCDFVRQVFAEKNGERCWKESHPWLNSGWFTNICEWVNGILEANEMILESPGLREQYELGQSVVLNCTVKGKCEEGSQQKQSTEILYTKTSYPVFQEGERTAAIAGVIGSIVPEILGVYEGDGTILMRDAGAITGEAVDDEAMINTIIEMQRLSMTRIDELKDGSLDIVDSEWVENKIEWILGHEALELWGRKDNNYGNGLYKDMVEELRNKTDNIKDVCSEIAKYKLPKTLVHGDLGSQNIGYKKEGEGGVYCIFDWATAFIGNPTYDLRRAMVMKNMEGVCIREKVISRFQKYWMPLASQDDIKSVFNISQVMFHIREIYELIRRYECYGSLYATHAITLMVESVSYLDECLSVVEG